jgi:hypothetical protein
MKFFYWPHYLIDTFLQFEVIYWWYVRHFLLFKFPTYIGLFHYVSSLQSLVCHIYEPPLIRLHVAQIFHKLTLTPDKLSVRIITMKHFTANATYSSDPHFDSAPVELLTWLRFLDIPQSVKQNARNVCNKNARPFI